jgi:hypothetical protein
MKKKKKLPIELDEDDRAVHVRLGFSSLNQAIKVSKG